MHVSKQDFIEATSICINVKGSSIILPLGMILTMLIIVYFKYFNLAGFTKKNVF